MSDLRESSTKKINIAHQNSNNINIICNLYNNIMTDQNENFISGVFLWSIIFGGWSHFILQSPFSCFAKYCKPLLISTVLAMKFIRWCRLAKVKTSPTHYQHAANYWLPLGLQSAAYQPTAGEKFYVSLIVCQQTILGYEKHHTSSPTTASLSVLLTNNHTL